MEVMGISIDSSILDQSIITSPERRKRKLRLKKQKEDLDGSRIFRDGDISNSPPNRRTTIKKKKGNTPMKGSFVKSQASGNKHKK